MQELFSKKDQGYDRTASLLQDRMKADYKKVEMSAEGITGIKRKIEEAKMENRREKRKASGVKIAVAAAAVIGVMVILPNTSATVAHAMRQIPLLGDFIEVILVRDYQYDDNKSMADISVTELKVEDTVEATTEDAQAQETLKKTTEEINAEIQQITDDIIAEFEANLKAGEDIDATVMQDVMVKSEILATTEDYFTLKLNCYQGAGSGYEWNYFYTIDLNTGERLALKALFKEGADYITPISENIISQMREQMAEDSQKMYWLDQEIEEWNFKQISDDTSFYINEKGNIVICFNEGDVAPMYMGTVEFEIPNEVVADLYAE